jgi:hypothetical protein
VEHGICRGTADACNRHPQQGSSNATQDRSPAPACPIPPHEEKGQSASGHDLTPPNPDGKKPGQNQADGDKPDAFINR